MAPVPHLGPSHPREGSLLSPAVAPGLSFNPELCVYGSVTPSRALISVPHRISAPISLWVPDLPLDPLSAHHQPSRLAISGSPPGSWGPDPPQTLLS